MTDAPSTGRRRALRLLPWVAVGVVMLALTVVAVDRLFVSETDAPSETTSVEEVAELAVVVTEDLDVQAGTDMLCRRPLELYRMTVEATVARWQSIAGGQVPEVDAEISDVDTGSSGSFVIAISSDEEGLEGEDRTFRVYVDFEDGRSCVVGVGGPRSQRPSTVFAGDGYTGVTSPPPAPTGTPSVTPSATTQGAPR